MTADRPDISLERLAAAHGEGLPDWVWEFAHTPGTRLHFRAGEVARAGHWCVEMGVRKVLVVTDAGIEKAGHLKPVLLSLGRCGVEAVIFDGVVENPTTDTVDACVAAARAAGVDGLVGLGGGSSMDTAKGCNFLLTNGGQMKDYWGVGKATKEMLPLLLIPTTAGTGSECQSFALISDAVTHAKMACGDKKAAAKHAILDPELCLTLPPRVTAVTGIDAVAHAVESAVCRKRTDVSLVYSRMGFRLLRAGMGEVFTNPGSLLARAQMLLGAAAAGTAIENSMLGAAHAAANPLTANYGIVHGTAVGLMLPHVIRLNRQDSAASATYDELAADLEGVISGMLLVAGLPASLSAAGVLREDIPQLAREAATQWTAQFNPVTVGAPEFEALYSAAWS